MIAVHINGGLGNQLFQYAIGRCLAYKNNTELKLEIFEIEKSKKIHHGYYVLGDFNTQENFATRDEIQRLKRVDEKKPEDPGIFQPELLKTADNTFLYGYFQNERYFEEIEDILRQELTPKNPFGRRSNLWRERILSAECAVSLHIRHGDYLLPLSRKFKWSSVIPIDYYLKCINELKKIYNNLTVFVFSDDIKWAKDNFKLDVPLEFVEGCENEVDELFLMSYCKHNITANSTFSWWGAWLNKNPDKKVFVPRSIDETKDVNWVSPNFMAVPVDYNKNPHLEFPPFLSIILYVENDINTVEFTMSSILSQKFNDYELIVIDSSNDGSGKICRRFAERENVSVIKQIHSFGKFEAWNKGIECAGGYYVLFMTGRDFILPQTVSILISFTYNYFLYAQKSTGDYLSYENYYSFYPNVICSTKIAEENPEGTLMISNIPNVKFSFEVDKPFQNLEGIGALENNIRAKIMLLANQQINNSFGTKFFKRTFLKENNIRFDEKNKFDTKDTELQFLTEAFMKSDRIFFIPQIFYGHLNP